MGPLAKTIVAALPRSRGGLTALGTAASGAMDTYVGAGAAMTKAPTKRLEQLKAFINKVEVIEQMNSEGIEGGWIPWDRAKEKEGGEDLLLEMVKAGTVLIKTKLFRMHHLLHLLHLLCCQNC